MLHKCVHRICCSRFLHQLLLLNLFSSQVDNMRWYKIIIPQQNISQLIKRKGVLFTRGGWGAKRVWLLKGVSLYANSVYPSWFVCIYVFNSVNISYYWSFTNKPWIYTWNGFNKRAHMQPFPYTICVHTIFDIRPSIIFILWLSNIWYPIYLFAIIVCEMWIHINSPWIHRFQFSCVMYGYDPRISSILMRCVTNCNNICFLNSRFISHTRDAPLIISLYPQPPSFAHKPAGGYATKVYNVQQNLLSK